MSDIETRLSDFRHSIERAIDNMHNAQNEQNNEVNEKLDALIKQTTKTNGRVSVHAMVLYPLGGMLLLLIGALLEKGIVTINLFKF